MKKTFAALGLTLLATTAMAVPINFDITGSSLTTTGTGLAASSYNDNTSNFSLDDGQSQSVTFGSVSVVGFKSGQLQLNIDFATPITSTVSGNGAYSVLGSFFYNEGHLTWNGPVTSDYNYGGNTGSFQIVFDNIDSSSWFSKPTWDLTGTITNLGSVPASVPEPSSLGLLAAGMVGLGLARRRAKVKAA